MAKNIEFKNLIKYAIWIIYIFLIVYISYQVLLAILGGSWATEDIIMSGIGLIITGMFSLFGILAVQSRNLGKIDERTKYLAETTKFSERRITFLERKITGIEGRILGLEKRN